MLRASNFRGASLGTPRWGGLSNRRTGFGVRLFAPVIGIVAVGLIGLAVFLEVRSEEDGRVSQFTQEAAPTDEGGDPSADRLREYLESEDRSRIGTPMLSDVEVARLTDRPGQVGTQGPSNSNSDPESAPTSPSSGTTSGSSSGSTSGSGSGSTSGGSSGGGSSGGGSSGGGSSGGSGGGSTGGGSEGGGPGGGGPGGGG